MRQLIRTVFFTVLAIVASAGVAVLTLLAIVFGIICAPFRAGRRHATRAILVEVQPRVTVLTGPRQDSGRPVWPKTTLQGQYQSMLHNDSYGIATQGTTPVVEMRPGLLQVGEVETIALTDRVTLPSLPPL